MTTPSKAMFEQWRRKQWEAPALPFVRKYRDHIHLNPNDDNVRDVFLEYVKAANVAMDEASKKLGEIPIFKWANKQPGFVRAVETVAPNLQKKYSEKYNWIEEVMTYFDGNPGYSLEVFDLEKMFSQTLGASWTGSIFRALDEYYFSSKAEELYKVAQRGPKAYRNMIQSVEELLSLTQGHQELKYDDSNRRLGKLLKDPAPSFDRLPITKNSQHKAEQLFVYRVWLVNQQRTGKPKADAIVELMTLDGFKHEFDIRTVERMCAKFKTAKLHIRGSKSAVAEI